MREFFIDLLNNLEKLTGIKQLERLKAGPEYKKDINALLDVLVNTCAMFPLIPKDAQKSIIRHAVISDGDFIGLNAKFVYKSLNAQRERYFKELAHQPSETPPDWKPVEGEARQEWLRKWNESLAGFDEKQTKGHVQELVDKLPAKPKGHVHPSTSPEKVLAAQLHNDYIRANYYPDGKKREGWISEKEWLETLNKQ